MRVVHGSPLNCLLALMLLLSGVADVSDVLCVSPDGRWAVERWSALGCAPETGAGAAQMKEHGHCADCADYSLLPPAAFADRTASSDRVIPAVISGSTAPASEPQTAAPPFPPPPDDSPPLNALPLSLRC